MDALLLLGLVLRDGAAGVSGLIGCNEVTDLNSDRHKRCRTSLERPECLDLLALTLYGSQVWSWKSLSSVCVWSQDNISK